MSPARAGHLPTSPTVSDPKATQPVLSSLFLENLRTSKSACLGDRTGHQSVCSELTVSLPGHRDQMQLHVQAPAATLLSGTWTEGESLQRGAERTGLHPPPHMVGAGAAQHPPPALHLGGCPRLRLALPLAGLGSHVQSHGVRPAVPQGLLPDFPHWGPRRDVGKRNGKEEGGSSPSGPQARPELPHSPQGEPTQGGLRNIAALQPGNRRVTFNDTLPRNPDKFN